MTGGTSPSRAAAWPALALLGLWAVALVGLLATGRHVDFLRPTLWPLLLLGSFLCGVFLTAVAARPGGHPAPSSTVWLRTAVLTIPLLYVIAGHGRSLGTEAFDRRAVDPFGSPGSGAEPPDEGPRSGRMTIPQIVRRGAALAGTTVRTIGQVNRGHGEPRGHFILFRFVVNCCVADAYPRAVLVEDPAGGRFPKDAWAEVRGVVDVIRVGPRDVLRIRADAVTATAPPTRPYLYDR